MCRRCRLTFLCAWRRRRRVCGKPRQKPPIPQHISIVLLQRGAEKMAALGIRNEVKKIGFRRMQRRTHRCFPGRSEEHTSELQSRLHLVCRLLLEKKKNKDHNCGPSMRNYES